MPAQRPIFLWLRLGALGLTAVALPWSNYLMSLSQLILLGGWILEGVVDRDLRGRFRRAFSDPAVLVFISFFLLHAVGLLWTTDMDWGLDLMRILLPVLGLPVVLASSPRLTERQLNVLLLLFAWSTVSITGFGVFHHWEAYTSGDYRGFTYISHIRVALLLALSSAILVLRWPQGPIARLLHVAGIVAALFLLRALGSLAGAFMLLVLVMIGVWWWSRSRKGLLKWALRGTILLLPLIVIAFVARVVDDYYPDAPNGEPLEERTAGGEAYMHNTTSGQVENGRYVWTYVAWDELERAWQRRSTVPFRGKDARGEDLSGTLARYMTSKGLRKDSLGMLAMTDADVDRVALGHTSVLQGSRGPLRERLNEIIFELDRYRRTGDPSGYSFAMRLEYWRAGLHIALRNWAFGVGTGDTQLAFDAEYDRIQSPLEEQWRGRAHNEYLTLWIGLGVFGLLWSLFSWWWPARRNGAWREPVFVAWAVIFVISCLTDDTIETQSGVTFFAYFYALFVFAAPPGLRSRPTAP